MVGRALVFMAGLAVGGIGDCMVKLDRCPRARNMASHTLVAVMVGWLVLSVALGAVDAVCSGMLENRARHCQRLGCGSRILFVIKQCIEIGLEQCESIWILVFIDLQTKQDRLGVVFQRVDPGCVSLPGFRRQVGQRL